MKRIFAAALAALLLLTACQATPAEDIVIHKDVDVLIEKALETPAASAAPELSLSGRFGFPESYTQTIEKGKLHIAADAALIVPEAPAMPMVRVKARDFTQDEVSRFWEVFIGDKTMYVPQDRLTKAQIEQRLVDAKRAVAELEASGSEDDLSTARYEREFYIPKLEALYAAAPERYEREIADGRLYDIELIDPDGRIIGSYTGLTAYETPDVSYAKEFGSTFRVANNSDMLESVVFDEKAEGYAGRPKVSGATLSYLDAIVMRAFNKPGVALPGDAAAKAGISPGKAKAAVASFLEEHSLPFSVYEVGFIEGETHDASGPLPPEAFCYMISCARIVDGVPCAIISGSSRVGTDALAKSWDYEHLTFRVDKSGILSMMWQSPLELPDVVAQDCALLPFGEITSVFETMMAVANEPLSKDEFVEELRFDIDRAALELVRIIEQNSTEHGLLVPAWRFYGTRTAVYNSPIEDEREYGCHLTVNAIDGSIIDLTMGY